MTARRLSSLVIRHTTLAVLLVYALLAVAMTWPIVPRLGTHVPGGTVDLWVHRWTFWWVKRSILRGQSPFYTHLLYHPSGVSLAYQNVAWLHVAAWLPLQAVVGGNAAYSLIYLAVFILNGFSMYLLVREFTSSRPAAFVGGVIYGFWPYTLSHYGHPNMMVTGFIPLALLHLRRTLERRMIRDALLAALFLALTGIARWQLLIMGGVIVGLYLLYECLRESGCRTMRTLGLLALTGLVAIALMAPLLVPVAAAYLTQDHPEDILLAEEASGQTDLLAYVLPTRYHPLWSEAAARVYENFTHNKLFVPFLGYTTLALGLYGAVSDWRRARFWLLAAAIYVALALGPQLRVNGQLYPRVPMPYRLVGRLFFIRAVRKPDRFNVFLGLPLGMLASLGVADLVRRRPRGWRSLLPVALASALILCEYNLVPYHTERPVTPDWYAQLGEEAGQFAVLDLPMAPRTFDKHYMFYQLTHQRPLVEGHVSRPPREATAFMDAVPLLRQLRQDDSIDPALVDVAHQLRPLAEADVRYLILHKDFARAEQLAAWRDWLTFEPAHEDEDLVVYRTAPRLGRDFTLAHALTEEIGLIWAGVAPTNVIQGAVVRVDARWGSGDAPGQDYDACLALSDPAGEVAHTRCMPLSSAWPPSRWEADEIVRSSYAIRLPLSLEPEDYSLALTLAEPSTGTPVGRSADLGRLRVDALDPTRSLQALFGDALRLRGYDLRRADDALDLTLYWQARREMSTSYKVFVHLIDPATGEVMAQDDAVPRRWTYPTTHWMPNEVVRDTIRLPLEEVPAGHYRLRVGCYDPATGERLPAYAAAGERYPDDAVPLTLVAP